MEKLKMETAKEKQLYSNKVLDAYVALIREKYSEIEIEDLMDEVGIENYSKIGDNTIALDQAQLNRFHQRLVMLIDNMTIARETGRHAVKPECLGTIRSLVLLFVGARRALSLQQFPIGAGMP